MFICYNIRKRMSVIDLKKANGENHTSFLACTSIQIRNYRDDKWSISEWVCLFCGKEETECLKNAV